MRLLLLLDLLGDELFQASDPTSEPDPDPSRSIQIPPPALDCQATFIQLWFDLGIKTQCASKHQRSIQVIPENKWDPRGVTQFLSINQKIESALRLVFVIKKMPLNF